MNYSMLVSEECEKTIEKFCKKSPILRDILKKKMAEIIENPRHYKPLKYDFAGERRVHILKSLVLKFKIDENKKIVCSLQTYVAPV
jgi:mRNA-degrading endonuclease RelE of RelBE toxin-antitoxin system